MMSSISSLLFNIESVAIFDPPAPLPLISIPGDRVNPPPGIELVYHEWCLDRSKYCSPVFICKIFGI